MNLRSVPAAVICPAVPENQTTPDSASQSSSSDDNSVPSTLALLSKDRDKEITFMKTNLIETFQRSKILKCAYQPLPTHPFWPHDDNNPHMLPFQKKPEENHKESLYCMSTWMLHHGSEDYDPSLSFCTVPGFAEDLGF